MLHESGDGDASLHLRPLWLSSELMSFFVPSRVLRDSCFAPADIAAALRERFARSSMLNARLSARHEVRWSLGSSSGAVSTFSFPLFQHIPFWVLGKGVVVVIVK